MEQKYKSILFLAVILALIGYTTGGTSNYYNYSNGSGDYVNKSGDDMTGNLTLFQYADNYYSLFNLSKNLHYSFFSYDLTGVLSEFSQDNTQFLFRVFDGGSALKKITMTKDDIKLSTSTTDRIKINDTGVHFSGVVTGINDNTKVNKSFNNDDSITGKLIVNVTNAYTGAGLTLLEFGRNSSASKFRATLNDANGAFNFRVNIKDDLTQDMTGSGWSFAMQPATHRFGLTYILPGTTTPINPFALYTNSSVYTNGIIQLGDPATTLQTQYPVQIYNLSGTGNAYVCVDSTGKLYRGNPTC